MVSLIVAYSKNRVIGVQGKMPWHLVADLVHLKKLTLGNVVILGKNSYESMVWYYNRSNRPMPGKKYIVLTRDKAYKPEREDAVAALSIDEAMQIASETESPEVFVIGGGEVFKNTLPLASKIYATEIDATIEGDTYFPEIDSSDWRKTNTEPREADEKNNFAYSFVTYERVGK